jgi:hypothetical protein
VSILIGFVFLAAAVGIDLGESSYYGLWLHVAAGLVIGGGLLWFLHDGDVDSSSLGGAGTTFRARDSSSSTLEFRA